MAFVAFPATVTVLCFRYRTMRYQFSAEGIRRSWGILFDARIQDNPFAVERGGAAWRLNCGPFAKRWRSGRDRVSFGPAFRAGRNYYRWRLVVWGFSQLFIVVSDLAPLVSFCLLAVIFQVLALPFSYFLQRLNYELHWYIVTDRSVQIRSGIWSVEEITMTFANIRDLRITAGPLQSYPPRRGHYQTVTAVEPPSTANV